MNSGKLIFIINGKGGAGKDTLIDIVSSSYPASKRSAIDPIKQIAERGGWRGEKDLKARKMLSELKRVFTEYNEYPMQYLLKEIDSFQKTQDIFLFIQVREPNEIQKLIDRVDCLPIVTILIRRKEASYYFGNSSDDMVDAFPYNHIFNNDASIEESGREFCELIRHIARDYDVHIEER